MEEVVFFPLFRETSGFKGLF